MLKNNNQTSCWEKPKNRQNPSEVSRQEDDMRYRLTAEGLSAFDQYGFEGVGTRRIAADAETNISSIAYHFESKKKLCLAVDERIADEIGSMFDERESRIGDKMALIQE